METCPDKYLQQLLAFDAKLYSQGYLTPFERYYDAFREIILAKAEASNSADAYITTWTSGKPRFI